MLQWKQLTGIAQVDEIIHISKEKPVLIFKHSTRCSISNMALARLERQWNFSIDNIEAYYLDLLQYREISNELSDRFNVIHQSPQVLLIKDGACVFHTSHNDISAHEIGKIIESENA
jgi:bacillithiol system protein YtxJ